jgi:serine phosphatase RsbU (regulator of sigma subunit)
MSFLGNAELGGLLRTHIFITYGVAAGNIIEVLLLSFALAYRIDLLKKENLRVNVENMEKEHRLQIIRGEMEIARSIQNSILPEIPALEPYFDVAAVYAPIEEIGGDYYDFYTASPHSLGVIIADVSGHGIPAALIASMVKMIFSVHEKIATDPALLLREMNDSLLSRCGGHFVTAGYCYIDREIGTVSYANAGHHPAMVFNRRIGRCDTLKARGRAMGMFAEAAYTGITGGIEKGDRIILFTDGIIECRNERDELYGEERFAEFIVDNRNANAKEFCARCMKGLKEWAGTMPFDDDITLVVIDLL